MNNKKFQVVQTKGKSLKKVRDFSVWQLAVFILAFGVIGYVIYHGFAATTTTTTTTQTWATYVSPFGDRTCDNNKLTTSTSDDCVVNCFGKSGCSGSCIPGTVNSTSKCRPMTMQTCSDATNQASPTLQPTQIDQGVDYDVWDTDSNCTYNNPNLVDTLNSTYSKSKTDTRIYAMGRGIITCVAANPSPSDKFDEHITLTQYCRGGNKNKQVPVGDDLCGGVPCNPPKGLGTWLVYQLTDSGSGFPAQGLKIYVSEGCNLSRNAIDNVLTGHTLHRRWKRGDHVTPNSVLCEVSHGTIEMGWANESRSPLINSSDGTLAGGIFKNEVEPAAYSCFWRKEHLYGYWSTAWGLSFNKFVLKYDGNRFSGRAGPNAYNDCTNFHKQPKYKTTW